MLAIRLRIDLTGLFMFDNVCEVATIWQAVDREDLVAALCARAI
jgi:hypothetical protein